MCSSCRFNVHVAAPCAPAMRWGLIFDLCKKKWCGADLFRMPIPGIASNCRKITLPVAFVKAFGRRPGFDKTVVVINFRPFGFR
jgi:hypothetical protein